MYLKWVILTMSIKIIVNAYLSHMTINIVGMCNLSHFEILRHEYDNVFTLTLEYSRSRMRWSPWNILVFLGRNTLLQDSKWPSGLRDDLKDEKMGSVVEHKKIMISGVYTCLCQLSENYSSSQSVHSVLGKMAITEGKCSECSAYFPW